MKTGLTTYSLDDPFFQIQLNSLLENDIRPDFIVLHNTRPLDRIRKYIRFFHKVFRQEKMNSLSFLLNKKHVIRNNQGINTEEKQNILSFLASAYYIRAGEINDADTIHKLKDLGPSITICNSGILKSSVLRLPEMIFVNVHSSQLPSYRGMNNVEWALWENKELYGTVHRISRAMDEGDILYQEKLNMKFFDGEDIEDYRQEAYRQSHALAGKALKMFLNNEISFTPQRNKGEPILQYYTMHPLLKKRLEEKLRRKISTA